LFYGWDEVAHFNAYNRPKLEAKKYGNIFAIMGAIQTDPSLLNEMFGLGVIWVHFSNLSRTSKWVWVDYRDVLGHFKENFSNKSKGNYMVEQVSLLHLKACN
jgi:hypothetical protein